jgi:hypothetical protein
VISTFLPLPSPKFQNFESAQTRLKFCGQLLKAPKAKAKVNKVHRNGMKAKFYTKKFCAIFHEISLTFVNSCNFLLNSVKV